MRTNGHCCWRRWLQRYIVGWKKLPLTTIVFVQHVIPMKIKRSQSGLVFSIILCLFTSKSLQKLTSNIFFFSAQNYFVIPIVWNSLRNFILFYIDPPYHYLIRKEEFKIQYYILALRLYSSEITILSKNNFRNSLPYWENIFTPKYLVNRR